MQCVSLRQKSETGNQESEEEKKMTGPFRYVAQSPSRQVGRSAGRQVDGQAVALNLLLKNKEQT